MNLTDLITPNDDLFAIAHEEKPFPTDAEMRAKKDRLQHIFKALKRCIMEECGPVTGLSALDEYAHACSMIMLIDSAIEYVTTHKKPS